MLRLSTISESVFNTLDIFFRGTVKINIVENEVNQEIDNTLNNCYIEWNMHQDYFDIAIFDLKASFSWMIPRFARKLGRRIQQLGLLVLYMDVAEELIETQDYQPFIQEPGMEKVLSYPQVLKNVINGKCLLISDWVKEIYRKCHFIIDLKLINKPYYLLGHFAPNQYEVPVKESILIIKEFNGIKLNPAFAYHQRI